MQSSSNVTDDDSARVQYSQKFHLWLDEPLDWNLKVRRLRLSGWCIAKKGDRLVAIRARLAGNVFDGAFDRERRDATAFVGLPDAPAWCGFTVDVTLPFGRKRLELQVAAADGNWRKAFARTVEGPLFVSTAERDLWAEIEEADAQRRYVVSFSRPHDWDAPARRLYVAGWCVDRTGGWIHGVRAVLRDRVFIGNARIDRPDLVDAFPGLKAARSGGFAVAINLPPGKQSVALQLKTVDGKWRQFFSREVTGLPSEQTDQAPLAPEEASFFEPAPPAPPRVRFWFDRPATWLQRSDSLRISGWCLATWGEDLAELRARVRGKTFRAHYGILRPDVAALSGGEAAALRSGFAVDGRVPWPGAKVVLEARSAGGAWEPFFAKRVRRTLGALRPGGDPDDARYAEWIRLYDQLSRKDTAQIERHLASFQSPTKISVLLATGSSDRRSLRRTIASVRSQLYTNWELCIAGGASTEPSTRRDVERWARHEPRLKFIWADARRLVAANFNEALAHATGEFVTVIHSGDELAPTALYFVALEAERDAKPQLLYGDQDQLDHRRRRHAPEFKSDWNLDLFLSHDYVGHAAFYSADLVRKVGGFRESWEGVHERDLTLRCIEEIGPEEIHHIPHLLFHRGAWDTSAVHSASPDLALGMLQDHLRRRDIAANVIPDAGDGSRIRYSLPAKPPLVSIVIPTRDRLSLLRRCLDSIQSETDYRNVETIIVDNDSADPEMLDYLRTLAGDGSATVLRQPGEFNFSRLNNAGVAQARGEFVALLNNDLEVINSDWLTEMVGHAARPEIGAVGARLWYYDGTLQHGGVILGVGGVATHAFTGLRRPEARSGRASHTQNFSAVTGACLVLRRDVYLRFGGLDEINLAVAFNDVDFCLRLREAGLRIVSTPYAELIHHESASRGLEDTIVKQQRFLAEVDYMRKKWGDVLEADPYYNPNLSIESDEQFKLAFPPRATKPWRGF